MVLINYLTIVKSDLPENKEYKLESFYELDEDSFFVKSELFYIDIISKLTDDSSLFFLYFNYIQVHALFFSPQIIFIKLNIFL